MHYRDKCKNWGYLLLHCRVQRCPTNRPFGEVLFHGLAAHCNQSHCWWEEFPHSSANRIRKSLCSRIGYRKIGVILIPTVSWISLDSFRQQEWKLPSRKTLGVLGRCHTWVFLQQPWGSHRQSSKVWGSQRKIACSAGNRWSPSNSVWWGMGCLFHLSL